MFREVEIQNYRGLAHEKIGPLAGVNLITGKNGSGKSSFLEAIFLNAGGSNPNLAPMMSAFRGENRLSHLIDTPFRLFFDLQDLKPAKINATWNGRKRRLVIHPLSSTIGVVGASSTKALLSGVRLNFKGPSGASTGQIEIKPPILPGIQVGADLATGQNAAPPAGPSVSFSSSGQSDVVNGHFIPPYQIDLFEQVHQQITKLTKEKRIGDLVAMMKGIEPSISNIFALSETNMNEIYLDIGRNYLMPLSGVGAGFFNLLKICAGITTNPRDGIFIVDEIENGIHHTLLKDLAKIVIDGSRSAGIQCFCSTHSGEMISAFAEAASELNFHDLCVVRFTRTEAGRRSTVFRGGEIGTALAIDGELR
ncbi:AAA family ATPase [Mesorhizobium sp. M0491]|uniref:AAA family ATPase n=1 Tax=Mesorhizobium sp. M0491 TaxID=2956950 RepID=UPI003338F800